MKRIVSFILVTLALAIFFIVPSFAVEAPKVVLNGQTLTFDVQPTVVNGFTFVPVRTIFESLGCIVVFDSKSQTVGALSVLDGTEIQLIINGKASVNSIDTPIDAPARLISGRTMVPLRFVGESLGADVNWDKTTNTIKISDEKCKLELSEVVLQNSSFNITLPKNWMQVAEDADEDGSITRVFSKDNNAADGINSIMVIEIKNPDDTMSLEELSEGFVSGFLEGMSSGDIAPKYEFLGKELIQNEDKEAILTKHSFLLTSEEENIEVNMPLKLYVFSTKTPEKLFYVMGIWMDPQTNAWAPVLKDSILSFEPLVAE